MYPSSLANTTSRDVRHERIVPARDLEQRLDRVLAVHVVHVYVVAVFLVAGRIERQRELMGGLLRVVGGRRAEVLRSPPPSRPRSGTASRTSDCRARH